MKNTAGGSDGSGGAAAVDVLWLPMLVLVVVLVPVLMELIIDDDAGALVLLCNADVLIAKRHASEDKKSEDAYPLLEMRLLCRNCWST